jgi:hypothetical protein
VYVKAKATASAAALGPMARLSSHFVLLGGCTSASPPILLLELKMPQLATNVNGNSRPRSQHRVVNSYNTQKKGVEMHCRNWSAQKIPLRFSLC